MKAVVQRSRILRAVSALIGLSVVASGLAVVTAGTPAMASPSCPSGAALYGIHTNGTLYGYFDSDPYHGVGNIDNSGMNNSTWGSLTQVFSGGHGVIYGVGSDGVLRSYKDYHTADQRDPVLLRTYGGGWAQFRLLWGNAEGVIYGIRDTGALVTYKQADPIGGNGAISLVRTFNSTWGNIRYAWSAGSKQFYAIDNHGVLRTYLHSGYVAGDGVITAGSYTNASWGNVRLAWSPAPGVIYGITGGTLSSYRDAQPTTGAGPITSIKANISSSWSGIAKIAPDLQLCVSPPSIPDTDTGPGTMADKAVNFALAQVGKEYEWGARGPTTYDCSGLVWRAFKQAGYDWARTTSAGQYNYPTKVPYADKRRGDLIFWSNNGSRSGIFHVAIYLGDGRIVNAANENDGVLTSGIWGANQIMPNVVRLG